MAYCFNSGQSLGFAVQLRLTPELKQALINARASGEVVSLRFREELQREAVLSVAGQEYFFSTAPQAGQVEVLEVDPGTKEASSVASVKQRLTLQRPVDTDARPRGWAGSLGLAGTLQEDRRKRAAVLLDNNQRRGVHPRVTTTTEVVTRPAPMPQPPTVGGAGPGPSGRFGSGMAGSAASSFRLNSGPLSACGRPGASNKHMELPRPRSQQPGGGAMVKPQPPKARHTPTPPPPDSSGGSAGLSPATAPPDGRPTSGGSGGDGSSPVGGGSGGAASAAAGGGGGGSGGGSAVTTAFPPSAPELPRTAVLAARRGDLPLVLAALLRDQPLTASSLQSRIDQAYRAAVAKLEAREYVKRVIDNCCNMSNNRMNLRPDVLAREGPRLDELLSGTSPSAGDTPVGTCASERCRAVVMGGRHSSAFGQGAAAKRMSSCSPDPRTSPEVYPLHNQQHSPETGACGGGKSSMEDAAATSGGVGTTGGEDDDDGGSQVQNSHGNAYGSARSGVRHTVGGLKRQKVSGTGVQPPPTSRNGSAKRYGAGRGGGGGVELKGYDDFDDLTDPVPVASAPPPPPPPRDSSAGRSVGQHHAGRATSAKDAVTAVAMASKHKVVVTPGGPRGLPSHAQLASSNGGGARGIGSEPAQSQRPPHAPPSSREAPSDVTGTGGSDGSQDEGAPVTSFSFRSRNLEPPVKGPGAPSYATAAAARIRARKDSEDGGTGGGSTGGGSESRMDTEGRGTMGAVTATAVTASPNSESVLDAEVQVYVDLDLDLQGDDKDTEWYCSYVDWKPEPHAAVQTTDQYEQYEREYRHKFAVYDRLNQKYNDIVREADAHRAAVEDACNYEERKRCVLALWRLGAAKWKLLEAWKSARRNLHTDLADLRSRVAEYVARQRSTTSTAMPQSQLQLQQS